MKFDESVESYHKNSFLQRYIAQNLVKNISSYEENISSIVEVGCGTGNLTSLINKTYPEAKVYTFDKSYNMVFFCKQHFFNENNTYFVADAEKFYVKKKVDLLFSNMSIQWLIDIKKWLCYVSNITKCVAISLPIKGSLQAWIDVYSHHKLTPPTLNFIATKDLHSIFQKQSKDYCIKIEKISQFFYKTIDFARYIKKIGAYNVSIGANKDLLKIIKKKPKDIEIDYYIAYCFVKF